MHMRSALRRWWPVPIPALLALLMYVLLPHFPRFTEWVVVRGLFRVVSFPLAAVMAVFPFSVTEICVVLGPVALLVVLVVWVVRILRHRDRRGVIAEKGCRFVAWCLSLALLMFMVMDGGNFSRLPLEELMELPDREYNARELYAVTADLAQKCSEARRGVAEDENGCMVLSSSLSDTLLAANDVYRPLRQDYPFLITGVWRVKAVALSHLWSYTGFSGVYCPWLGEANVNVDQPDCDIGHTAAHELAHTIGFAKENECNFLGYLSCVTSGQPDFVYSGYLAAFIYCNNALYGADQELWAQAYGYLSDGVRRDLQQKSAYWDSFEGEVMDSAQDFNDAFIKVNGVESGRISYSEAVGLVLKYYDKTGEMAALVAQLPEE